MDEFSSHTFSLITDKDQRVFCEYHFKTQQGIRNFTDEQATRIAGENADYATENLFQAIEDVKFPKWRVSVQIMTEQEADNYHVNPFDLTKVWSHRDHPLIEIGEMELNRNPQNHFSDVEQPAFASANIVPGMGYSPDKMLQARLLSYPDAHRYRLGVSYAALPVNRPHTGVNTCNRDGFMRADNSGTGEPNSFGGPKEAPQYAGHAYNVQRRADRFYHREGNDGYRQAGDLFRVMSKNEQQRLISNIVGSMKNVTKKDIQLGKV